MTTPNAPNPPAYRSPEAWRAANPLRAWRNAHSPVFSQAAIAEALGVHETTIRYWENGRRTPDGANMTRLAVKLERPNLPTEWLAWQQAGKTFDTHWL